MTEPTGDGEGRPRRIGSSDFSDRRRPKPDIGPASSDPRFLGCSPSRTRKPASQRSREELVIEAIEAASVKAEEAVAPFLDRRMEVPLGGASAVEVLFLDNGTRRVFLRVRAVGRSRILGSWLLIRRWARANNDADLDETMCRVVAESINADFRGLLRASVVTLLN